MATSSSPQPNERDSNRPVVHLDELDADELRLVASFVELVRSWRGSESASGAEFQLLWQRMKAKGVDRLDDEDVMSVALDAQRAVRRAGA